MGFGNLSNNSDNNNGGNGVTSALTGAKIQLIIGAILFIAAGVIFAFFNVDGDSPLYWIRYAVAGLAIFFIATGLKGSKRDN